MCFFALSPFPSLAVALFLVFLFSLFSSKIVQDLASPFPFDLPMVLIKPREACSTAEVYKVINNSTEPPYDFKVFAFLHGFGFSLFFVSFPASPSGSDKQR